MAARPRRFLLACARELLQGGSEGVWVRPLLRRYSIAIRVNLSVVGTTRAFDAPSLRTLMFAGFRSLWMIPYSCAASSDSAIWRAIGSASSRRNCAARDALREILAFDEFHHEGRDAGTLFEAIDAGDVRLVQRREGLRFARESGEPIRIVANESGRTLSATLRLSLV